VCAATSAGSIGLQKSGRAPDISGLGCFLCA
jgi:hypothetical protein